MTMLKNLFASNEGFSLGAHDGIDTTIAITSAQQDYQFIVASSAQQEHALGIIESLENLAFVAGTVTKATKAEVALTIVAGEMALAGTGLALDAVNPSVETREGGEIAVEGFKQMAKNLWEGIKKLLLKVRKAVSNFFSKYFGATVRLRRAAESMRKKAEGMSAKTVEEAKTELTSEANLLRKNNTTKIMEGTVVASELDVLRQLTTAVFDNYTVAANTAGEKLEEAIGKFTIETKQGTANNVFAIFAKAAFVACNSMQDITFPPNEAGKPNSSDNRFKGVSKVTMSHVIGNVMLVKTDQREVKDGSNQGMTIASANDITAANALAFLNNLRKTHNRVMPSPYNSKTREPIADATVGTYTLSCVEEICDAIVALCDLLDGYNKSKTKQDIEKIEIKLKKASDTVDKDFTKNDDVLASTKSQVRAVLNFNKAYTSWVSEPHMPLVANIMAVSRAALTACSKSLSNYS